MIRSRRLPGPMLLAAGAVGVALGLAAFTFGYARGYSYLSNDPAVCANCHIMSEHFSAWTKASHRAVAGCNDCHTPHTLVAKYATKARNGFWHSFYFTTGRYPDPLRITERNRRVTLEACRYCHAAITEAIDHRAPPARDGDTRDAAPRSFEDDRINCISCHRYVGHFVR